MNTLCYDLEKEEGKAIRDIYEKKLALENLAKIIKPDENPEM